MHFSPALLCEKSVSYFLMVPLPQFRLDYPYCWSGAKYFSDLKDSSQSLKTSRWYRMPFFFKDSLSSIGGSMIFSFQKSLTSFQILITIYGQPLSFDKLQFSSYNPSKKIFKTGFETSLNSSESEALFSFDPDMFSGTK